MTTILRSKERGWEETCVSSQPFSYLRILHGNYGRGIILLGLVWAHKRQASWLVRAKPRPQFCIAKYFSLPQSTNRFFNSATIRSAA